MAILGDAEQEDLVSEINVTPLVDVMLVLLTVFIVTAPLLMNAVKVKLPQDEKAVHVLPLTFTAPAEASEIDELFTITIPGRAEPLTFRAKGKVVP